MACTGTFSHNCWLILLPNISNNPVLSASLWCMLWHIYQLLGRWLLEPVLCQCVKLCRETSHRDQYWMATSFHLTWSFVCRLIFKSHVFRWRLMTAEIKANIQYKTWPFSCQNIKKNTRICPLLNFSLCGLEKPLTQHLAWGRKHHTYLNGVIKSRCCTRINLG